MPKGYIQLKVFEESTLHQLPDDNYSDTKDAKD
jgi:hypothetical protein